MLLLLDRPSPGITWTRKNGVPLPKGRSFEEEFNSVLVIKDIHEEDEGDYVCTGTNAHGSDSGNIFLDIQCE